MLWKSEHANKWTSYLIDGGKAGEARFQAKFGVVGVDVTDTQTNEVEHLLNSVL